MGTMDIDKLTIKDLGKDICAYNAELIGQKKDFINKVTFS